MAEERESTAVGYRLRMQPTDLSTYPDQVKMMWFEWLTELGLQRKLTELRKGWDKDGKSHPLAPRTIKYRKSEVGPVHKRAPRGIPALDLSRVMSLLTGRAHLTSAEFWWGFDSVTGASFARILHYWADDQGHDVFGLSPAGTAWVTAQALKRWAAWKAAGGYARPAVNLPGAKPVPKVAVRQPIRKIEIPGRMDLENMTLAGNEAEIRRAMAAGRFPGFRRLNMRGEQWKPGHGLGPFRRPPKPKPPPTALPTAPPKPPPKPPAIPVSAALDIQADSPRIQRHAKAVLEAIDKIHSDGNLPRIPVKSFGSGINYEGFIELEATSHQPIMMKINKAASHERITIAHETGHVIDYAGIPRVAPQIGAHRDFRSEELFKDFIKAVDNSESIKTLRSREFEEKLGTYKLDQHHMAYLLQDNEIWARAYSQWITEKSADPDMAAQLENILVLRRQQIYPFQWTAEDFRPIATAIDGIFRKLGWLK